MQRALLIISCTKRKSEIYVLTCSLTHTHIHVCGVTCAYVYVKDRDQHDLSLEVALFLKQGLSLYWSSPIYWITGFRNPLPLPQTHPGLELGIKHLTSYLPTPCYSTIEWLVSKTLKTEEYFLTGKQKFWHRLHLNYLLAITF